jgi:hypothetical protein
MSSKEAEAEALAATIAASFVVATVSSGGVGYKNEEPSGSSKVGEGVSSKVGEAVERADSSLTDEMLAKFRKIIWPPGLSEDDTNRWHSEGFVFSEEDHIRAGLRQSRGGPCGVFAAVQAFMLKGMLFENGGESERQHPLQATDEVREATLVGSLSEILWNARPSPSSGVSVISCPPGATTLATKASHFTVHSGLGALDEVRRIVREKLKSFQSETGVVLFMFSLVATRTIDQVKEDMDDSENYLTAQFGHCAQELVNLLLCGYASSQVHDGEVALGDSGLVLRGVSRTPAVGYLSLLESLRYCTVGEYYKTPAFPIWIVASESHFTILFSTSTSVGMDSPEDSAEKRLRRAFAKQDAQGGGFIASTSIVPVLRDLELMDDGSPECSMAVNRLQKKLDSQSTGIVLWQDFVSTLVPVVVENMKLADWDRPETTPRGQNVGGAASWSCPACTYLNEASRVACEICTTPKPENLAPTGPVARAVQTAESNPKRQRVDGGSSSASPKPSSGFALFHYNGLSGVVKGQKRGAILTKCRVHKRIAVVGVATGLANKGVDKVIQTKWAGCEIEWEDGKCGSVNG